VSSEREITITGPGGEKRVVTVSWHERQWNECGCSRTECTIHLRAEGFDIKSVGYDIFEAFCGIRDQLAAQSFYPLCYGASRSCYLSGMLRDMSGGHVVYKLQPGRPVSTKDIVNIFDSGPGVEVATVAQQKAFWLKFLAGETEQPL
jgi:hypothetical protein